MGDLNDLLESNEKCGRVTHNSWMLRGFKEAVHSSGLMNFPFDGYQFTWGWGRGTLAWVEEKLDRILVIDRWVESYGDVKAWSITCHCC